MPFIAAFGAYLPSRTVSNEELAPLLGCTPAWIQRASGIEERRYASAEESVEVMAARAGSNYLENAAVLPRQIGMVMVASGSRQPHRFSCVTCYKITLASFSAAGSDRSLNLTQA